MTPLLPSYRGARPDGKPGSMCAVVVGMTGTVMPPAPATTLTAGDRCDRCGAQARVRAVLANGDLLFCAHHAHEYEDKLKPASIEWVDETDALTS